MNKLSLTLNAVISILFSSLLAAAPFGESSDIEYADKLWSAMDSSGYVGNNALYSTPYTGQHPHGAILDTFDAQLTVDGKTNVVIIKRNYGGKGVSKSAVADNPEKFLKAITVMYKRKGFDPENKDWFWAKFKPNGDLHSNPKGMKLAGKVAKGAPKGCISCHTAAPGGDMVYNHNRIK